MHCGLLSIRANDSPVTVVEKFIKDDSKPIGANWSQLEHEAKMIVKGARGCKKITGRVERDLCI